MLQVRAVRSDGRRQRVIYNFLRGNDLGAFEINSNNGLIRVRDPDVVDYEAREELLEEEIKGGSWGSRQLKALADSSQPN